MVQTDPSSDESDADADEEEQKEWYVNYWFETEADVKVEAPTEEAAIEKAKSGINLGATGTIAGPMLSDCMSFTAREIDR